MGVPGSKSTWHLYLPPERCRRYFQEVPTQAGGARAAAWVCGLGRFFARTEAARVDVLNSAQRPARPSLLYARSPGSNPRAFLGILLTCFARTTPGENFRPKPQALFARWNSSRSS